MNLSFYKALSTTFRSASRSRSNSPARWRWRCSSRRRVDFLWIGIAVFGLLLLLPIWKGAAHPRLAGRRARTDRRCLLGGVYPRRAPCRPRRTAPPAAAAGAARADRGPCSPFPSAWRHAGAALLRPRPLMLRPARRHRPSAIPCALEMIALAAAAGQHLRHPAQRRACGGRADGSAAALGEVLTGTQWLAVCG